MKSPRDRYYEDPEFHRLVDSMEALIHNANFTPSEIRQAAMLACINYEMKNIRHKQIFDPKLEDALQYIHEATEKHS